jgi:hypothetical protein
MFGFCRPWLQKRIIDALLLPEDGRAGFIGSPLASFSGPG